jgi:hypothetical protein
MWNQRTIRIETDVKFNEEVFPFLQAGQQGKLLRDPLSFGPSPPGGPSEAPMAVPLLLPLCKHLQRPLLPLYLLLRLLLMWTSLMMWTLPSLLTLTKTTATMTVALPLQLGLTLFVAANVSASSQNASRSFCSSLRLALLMWS